MRKLLFLPLLLLLGCHQSESSSRDQRATSGSFPSAGLASTDCRPDSGTSALEGEREAVATAVRVYFQGHATGDGNYYRQVFHPEARLFWVKGGAFMQKTRDEFAAGASGKPAPDEARRARRIAAIDVAGDAAMAKVELDYPEVRFVDYLSLLKIEGKWTIVNKIFHREDIAASAMR